MAIVLSVLRFTASDYPFGILDLRLSDYPFGILDLRLSDYPFVIIKLLFCLPLSQYFYYATDN